MSGEEGGRAFLTRRKAGDYSGYPKKMGTATTTVRLLHTQVYRLKSGLPRKQDSVEVGRHVEPELDEPAEGKGACAPLCCSPLGKGVYASTYSLLGMTMESLPDVRHGVSFFDVHASQS